MNNLVNWLAKLQEATSTSYLKRSTNFLYAGAFSLMIGLYACQDHRLPQPGQSIQSTSPKPDWGPTIGPQMLAVIEELGRLSPIPLNTLTPQQARQQPSFKDAVNSLLDKNKIPRPTANVTSSQQTIPGYNNVPIRIVVYTPKNKTGPLPVIVYYHGGGWVIASPEVYEYSTLALAEETGAIVVSVDYRLAPENKFPTAHEDAYAAYKWVTQNAASINGNPAKIALAGESAGGNMAITTAMLARDRGIALPVHILSVFPVADNNLDTPSYNIYKDAKPLNRPLVEYFTANYFNSPADGNSPLISLVDVADLTKLPPTTIIGAEIDPLQSEGMYLRDKLANSGVTVTYQLYPGATHEFFGMYAIVPQAQQAHTLAATQLINAFQ
ncbi:alpha/beta hydrolase [Spirosoma foliorum]|uniref:Alpha/beta hydrolase n=1 Tax=Spirosoma foliorum TaxID=2710596 RepID=A0A7G5GYU3_9BACT|nr:alpha/beta hydrolase [Spirosoma foliorum]QMW04035.1 alpha/beta hydrolase [Spirosoma foliorum]